jgi:hypothetical protein
VVASFRKTKDVLMRRLFSILLFVALAGCATGYRADGIAGGYSEAQIDRNAFRVTYRGNVTTKQSETDELALLRAAEVASQHGFRYFVSGGNAPTGSAVSVATNVVTVPATTIDIYCFTTRPLTSAIVYDAEQVIATLGPKYGRL